MMCQKSAGTAVKWCGRFAAMALSVAAAVVTVEVHGVTLQLDQVKQRYPWNGLVDIDYTISFNPGETLGPDDNLEVLVIDKSAKLAVTNRAVRFLQAPLPLTAGKHRITWDAHFDGVKSRIADAEVHVVIARHPAAYMVIDVSPGSGSNAIYPVDFLNEEPEGGFNAEKYESIYKGDKIVLKRIHAGSFMAGSPEGGEVGRVVARETQHAVAFSKPFYIGIFEITQKQYNYVMGSNPSTYKENVYRPVETVSYNTVRGGDWPGSKLPGSSTFMGLLLSRCRAKDKDGHYTEPVTGFDLPTEFQWEYACRAGTTGGFSTTNEYDNLDTNSQAAQMDKLSRYAGNQNDGKGGGFKQHVIVGSYDPNPWGLYDMHGNVMEWVRDNMYLNAADLKQYVDPPGSSVKYANNARMKRGGSWSYAVTPCRAADRGSNKPDGAYDNGGFRLCREVP